MDARPAMFDCVVCHAKGAVAPPAAGSPVVVCGACRRTQPVRLYQAQFAHGGLTGTAAPPSAGEARLIGLGAALLVGVVGLAGVLTVGTVLRGAPWANGFGVLMSMIFCGGGVRALRSPTTLRISPNAGTDAFGMAQYGPTHAATAKQGTTMGITFLIVGVLFLGLGVFLGRIGP